MKPRFPWRLLRFVYELHFVSERSFAREVGIDRTWLRERANKEAWQTENVMTLEQMQQCLLDADKDGRAARAEEIRQNIRVRRTAWALAAEMLRLAVAEARESYE